MNMFLLIYGVFALCFFIVCEVLSVITRREKNCLFAFDVYNTNHARILAISVLFPIALLIILVEVVTENILDRSGR